MNVMSYGHSRYYIFLADNITRSKHTSRPHKKDYNRSKRYHLHIFYYHEAAGKEQMKQVAVRQDK